MRIKTAKFQNGGRFTSREEWIHPERIGTSFELIVVTEGCVRIEEAGCRFSLSEGDVLFLEPEKRHLGWQASIERVSFYWLHFEEFDLFGTDGIEKCMHLADPYSVMLLCRQLLHASTLGYDVSVLHALLHALLGEIAMQGRSMRGEGSSLASRVREWIRINSDRELTVADVSMQFGYNVDYLSRIFSKCYGHGLKAEIDEMHLGEIKRLLLETDLTLFQIADRTGSGDYKLFLKFFKYHEGITPTEFRRLYSKLHTNNR